MLQNRQITTSESSVTGTIEPPHLQRIAAGGAEPTVTDHIVADLPSDLRRDWQALAQRSAEPNAFAEPWFVEPAIAHFGGNALRMVTIRRASQLIGLIFLRPERRYGRIPITHVENWGHEQQFLGTPMIAKGEEESFWRALLLHLDAAPWPRNFLHLHGLPNEGPVLHGLQAATSALARGCDVVHRSVRAELSSDLPPQAYYEAAVRKKKRKELARLRNRLAELGPLRTRTLDADGDLDAWCDAFLRMEAAGWKGRDGTALASCRLTRSFFLQMIAGAHAAGRLQFLALELDSRPIAMLVNFLVPPGSYSFKTAFDEEYARFSPGVLLQIENLSILDRPDIAWMDSCAAEHHPMIDSLWTERRTLVRVTIPLRGVRRRVMHAAARSIEALSAARRPKRRFRPGEET